MQETRKLYHERLEDLLADVQRLGALAGEAIAAGTQALLDEDLSAVEQVVVGDRALDEVTHSAEQQTCLLLATQQPMAGDLRTLVTVLRVIHELERIGDLMAKVAKATRRLYPTALSPGVRGVLERMGRQAGLQLRTSMEAFVDRDADRAAAVTDMDDVMDDLQKELFRHIFTHGTHDDEELQRAVQIALVGRYFERVGDHAANVAERVNFMVTGQFPFEPH